MLENSLDKGKWLITMIVAARGKIDKDPHETNHMCECDRVHDGFKRFTQRGWREGERERKRSGLRDETNDRAGAWWDEVIPFSKAAQKQGSPPANGDVLHRVSPLSLQHLLTCTTLDAVVRDFFSFPFHSRACMRRSRPHP
jgi:hypothetical protein